MSPEPLLAFGKPFQLGQTIYILDFYDGIKAIVTTKGLYDIELVEYDNKQVWTIGPTPKYSSWGNLNRYAATPEDAVAVVTDDARRLLQRYQNEYQEQVNMYQRHLENYRANS